MGSGHNQSEHRSSNVAILADERVRLSDDGGDLAGPLHVADRRFGWRLFAVDAEVPAGDGEDGLMSPDQRAVLARVFLTLHSKFGVDFSDYRIDLIERSVFRRSTIAGDSDFLTYCQRIVTDSQELKSLFDELLLGINRFVPQRWCLDQWIKPALVHLVRHRVANSSLRIWVAGCSTGEEVYAIVCMLDRYLSDQNLRVDIEMLATDLDEKALEIANRGIYPSHSVEHLSRLYKEMFVLAGEEQARVLPTIKNRISFFQHNVLKDAPIPSVDLIVCQNIFHHLREAARADVMNSFEFAANDRGLLLLGSDERLPQPAQCFQQVPHIPGLYVREVSSNEIQ